MGYSIKAVQVENFVSHLKICFLVFQYICSYVLRPVAFIMGVPWEDSDIVAELLGVKTFLNEFVAYTRLAEIIKNRTKMTGLRTISVSRNVYSKLSTGFILKGNDLYLKKVMEVSQFRHLDAKGVFLFFKSVFVIRYFLLYTKYSALPSFKGMPTLKTKNKKKNQLFKCTCS